MHMLIQRLVPICDPASVIISLMTLAILVGSPAAYSAPVPSFGNAAGNQTGATGTQTTQLSNSKYVGVQDPNFNSTPNNNIPNQYVPITPTGDSGATKTGGGGGGGGGQNLLGLFNMLEVMDTSNSGIEKNFGMAFPYEKLWMDSREMQTKQPTEQAEQFGATDHSGERRPIVPPVFLPPGQCNAQEYTKGGGPGFMTKSASNFHKRLLGQFKFAHNRVTDFDVLHYGQGAHAIFRQIGASPELASYAAQVGMQARMQLASDASADSGENMLAGALGTILSGLINVANEDSGTPCSSEQLSKTVPEAVWMVQQMYKSFYIYMAILLLLPGAIITHMKAVVSYGLLSHPEDSESNYVGPWVAVIRSIIAIFLIFATQLIMSWCIDVGNSTTLAITSYVQPTVLMNWDQEQLYNIPWENQANEQVPPNNEISTTPIGGNKGTVRGKLTNGSEKKSQVETCSDATRFVQLMFNLMNYCLGAALLVIIGFQIALTCYLFLLGPIAAAFYAWPSGVGNLFNKVFTNWVDSVVNVSLWRFWWCVLILAMYVRIQWLIQMGAYDPYSQWEMMMYTAFQVMMCYVPFAPFEFRPGDMVDKILEKAKQLQQNATSGSGQSGGTAPSGGQPSGHAHGQSTGHGHGGRGCVGGSNGIGTVQWAGPAPGSGSLV